MESKKDTGIEEILTGQATNFDFGLSATEAAARLSRYGLNEIPEKEESVRKRIFKRFWAPIPWMIEIAALLSAIAGKWDDFTIITVLLFVNVGVDFFQEAKALNALKTLKGRLAKKAVVKRDGTYQQIDANQLVPGDIIKIKIGDIVPADAVAVSGAYLQVDQSALTGESLPIDKKTGDIIYDNSIAKMGEMEAVVTATAMNTFFGKSAALVIQATQTEKSHFQKAVLKIGNGLILLTICMAVILVIVSLFRHDPMLEVLRFILVLVVASIPVALPAVLSVTMAIGAMNLAKKQAIVSRLAAIEELAGVDVLCSDKTGTLTQNKMSVTKPLLYNQFSEDDLFLYAVLASRKENNDPIEIPLFEEIKKKKLDEKLVTYTSKNFIPFDPISKKTQVTIAQNGEEFTIIKGAPQVINQLCSDISLKNKISNDVESFAVRGFRTLAVAVKTSETTGFSFVGLIPMQDPPREDSKSTIAEAKKLGVQIKMITGDNQAIAKEIATSLEIGSNVMDATGLRSDGTVKEFSILAEIIGEALYKKLSPAATDTEIRTLKEDLLISVKKEITGANLLSGHIRKHESEILEIIEQTDGFSQVLPEDKYLIIDTLQKADHIVGMTGDGVNDAPALKKADAGIAVEGATDAARAAADVVLVLPGLSVIVNAIQEARLVFERMKSYATFRISETIRVILFMSLSILVFNFYPVTAVMIILLALLNDIPIMMIAYDNAKVSNTPVRWNMKEVTVVSSVLGVAGVIASFLLFYLLQENYLHITFPDGDTQNAFIQTMIFLKLSVAGHSTLYTTRTGDKHFWQKPYPSLKLFIPTFLTQIIATIVAAQGFFMTAIGWKYALYIWGYSLMWFFINDFLKVRTFRVLARDKEV
ncbi:plasma-membrane proton-efflux P-type ATPase [Fluviicola sp.]|jgi:H+-transporting ATPase|uniref:plasma-membrane proton-efflux P-type ATPase n=1 Tax=Fluviicola sp. TaxID=1917219 RepID=UPI002831F034|nr:plasma-membrane proton-efflux P-type ATPase [Fluviicola sp.]MDR0801907.1 plasma-membrane proton-efflux P-type ATPase [Fluviicola sp.]